MEQGKVPQYVPVNVNLLKILNEDEKSKYVDPRFYEMIIKAKQLEGDEINNSMNYKYANFDPENVLDDTFSVAPNDASQIAYIYWHIDILNQANKSKTTGKIVKSRANNMIATNNAFLNNLVTRFDSKYLDMLLSNEKLSTTSKSGWLIFKNRKDSKVLPTKDAKAFRCTTQAFKYLLIDILAQAFNKHMNGRKFVMSVDVVAAIIYNYICGETDIVVKLIDFITSDMTIEDVKAVPVHVWFPDNTVVGNWVNDKCVVKNADGVEFTLLYGDMTQFQLIIDSSSYLLRNMTELIKGQTYLYLLSEVEVQRHLSIFKLDKYVQAIDNGQQIQYLKVLNRLLRQLIIEIRGADEGEDSRPVVIKMIEASLVGFHLLIRNKKHGMVTKYDDLFYDPVAHSQRITNLIRVIRAEIDIAEQLVKDKFEVESHVLTIIRSNFDIEAIEC